MIWCVTLSMNPQQLDARLEPTNAWFDRHSTTNTSNDKDIIHSIQPFSQKSRTPTVAKEFQIGLCGVVEADLELFCNSWSAGFSGERLYDIAFQAAILHMSEG